MCENAHSTTTRAQSLEAPAADTQIQRACAVEMHIDDVERHECTVNSSELAAHARAAHLSKHTCFSPTVRTPNVSTLFGEIAQPKMAPTNVRRPGGWNPLETSPIMAAHTQAKAAEKVSSSGGEESRSTNRAGGMVVTPREHIQL